MRAVIRAAGWRDATYDRHPPEIAERVRARLRAKSGVERFPDAPNQTLSEFRRRRLMGLGLLLPFFQERSERLEVHGPFNVRNGDGLKARVLQQSPSDFHSFKGRGILQHLGGRFSDSGWPACSSSSSNWFV
jgi:hypothetical protein